MHNNQEEQKQENIAVKKGKKLLRDKALKLGKKAAKAAAKVAVKASLAIGKALLGLLAGVGAPFILIIIGIVILVLLIFIIISIFFVFAPDSLDDKEAELLAHIHEVSEATVDMSKSEQIPYRVPPELIIAALQVHDTSSAKKSKKAATELAEGLRPIFTYTEVEGVTESYVKTCVEGEDECTYSETYETPYTLNVLTGVQAWDREVSIEVKSKKTGWSSASRSEVIIDENGEEKTVRYTTRTQSDFFWSEETENMDYAHYDRQLTQSPFDFGLQSKLTVEAIYEAVGKEIYYTEWLTQNSLIGFDGVIIPGGGVPTEYIQYYLEAEKKYKVDWFYLAAVHFVETAFSTHPSMESSVGAQGHMQFMPCTFTGWSYPGCGGLGYVEMTEDMKRPETIQRYGGYGVDANGDGVADPWDIKDAIFSAANYLNKSGFSSNIRNAILHYNHAEWYADKVIAKANEFKEMAMYMPGEGTIPELVPGAFMRPALGRKSSGFGPRSLGSKSYHYGVDIANGSGTPIVAIADGIVVKSTTGCPQVGYIESKCGGGWGNHVRVHHMVQGKVFEAIYAHFSSVAVVEGQSIKQGQFLGGMGQSGRVTGVHLHLELYNGPRNGYKNVLNPALYVPL